MRRCLDLPDPFPARLWVDAVTDCRGIDAFGPYAEAFWLPHVGPSAFLLARRMLVMPISWDKATLAKSVGIGHSQGRSSALERSLARLEGFRLAQEADGALYVRRYWPRLPANLLAKMPPLLQHGEADLAAA